MQTITITASHIDHHLTMVMISWFTASPNIPLQSVSLPPSWTNRQDIIKNIVFFHEQNIEETKRLLHISLLSTFGWSFLPWRNCRSSMHGPISYSNSLILNLLYIQYLLRAFHSLIFKWSDTKNFSSPVN